MTKRIRDSLRKNNVCFGLEQVWTIDGKLKAKKSGSDRVINIDSIDSLKQIMGRIEEDLNLIRGTAEMVKLTKLEFITKLQVLFWNVHGLGEHKKDLIRNRLDEMSDIFSANDIICFAETWLENSDNLLFWGDENEFEEINTEALRRHHKGRASSGISLFLRKLILPGSEILSKDSNHI